VGIQKRKTERERERDANDHLIFNNFNYPSTVQVYLLLELEVFNTIGILGG